MKRSKKSVVTIILAVMMIAAMAVSAFAAAGTKIAITNNDVSNNTYSIYKVMSAKEAGQNGNDKVYAYKVTDEFKDFFGDTNYGGYKLNDENAILKSDGTLIPTDGRYVSDDTKGANNNSSAVANLAAALAKYARDKKLTPIATTSDEKAVDVGGVGYYLVAQTATGKADDKEVASKPVLVDLTNGDANILAKNDTTDLEKVIVENGNEVKANNVNIGDTVNFKITTKIPTYEAGLNERIDEASLVFELKDTFCEGLTYNESSLEIAGFEKDTDYTASYAKGVLTISFTKASILANQGKSVVATYSAVLNDKAKVESTDGNENDVELKYTNNPDQKDDFKTLTDETKTYTYGFKIHKVDKAAPSKNLGNAEFVLENSDEKYAVCEENNGTYTLTGWTDKKDDATRIVSKGADTFAELAEVKGLDAGTYYLEETKAPDEFTVLEGKVQVTITDKGESTENKPNGIAELSAGGAGNAKPDASTEDALVKDKDGKVTGAVEVSDDGTIDLAVYVENAKGISLPETGATSALVCMIGGALIVLIGLLYYFFAVRRSSKKTSR